uniref:Malonic semialdehyde reductase n=1 Tax=Kwoniella bestiolae CBS 10118 TaxID=1296100 RepID=A0A1B9G3Y5_9TREE|nr:malonic semialdehyde reductase [Kwoniella bestiolae CBS 10118]OCF25726.1 malonic semialdehyde reductase [Kwoniella bestiolae CBS 10118]
MSKPLFNTTSLSVGYTARLVGYPLIAYQYLEPCLLASLAVITGASGGIGEATAILFARAGCNVILLARRQEALDEVAKKCREEGGDNIKVLAKTLDVNDRDAVERLIHELKENGFDTFDILVNNAGGAVGKEQVGGLSDIDYMISTNLVSLMQISQVFVNEMKKADIGHIINIGSLAGREAYVGGSVYCAVKHAVKAFTTSLMKELVATGIKVSEVAPGFVETNFSVTRFRGDADAAAKVYEGFTPCDEDIAEEIVWCALRPPHVQIAELYVLPSAQASATIIARK